MTDPITPEQLDELDRLERAVDHSFEPLFLPAQFEHEWSQGCAAFIAAACNSARAMIDELREGRNHVCKNSPAMVVQAFNNLAAERDALRFALRDLRTVPAVTQALGSNHVNNCRCPLCIAEALAP